MEIQMKKKDFLAAFRREINKLPAVGKSHIHVELLMTAVEATLNGGLDCATDSKPMLSAWREIGGTGDPTLKQLWGLQ